MEKSGSLKKLPDSPRFECRSGGTIAGPEKASLGGLLPPHRVAHLAPHSAPSP
jgi:hypothetical protein